MTDEDKALLEEYIDMIGCECWDPHYVDQTKEALRALCRRLAAQEPTK